MTFCDFSIKTCGKWILAGEHAVLRGHGALVFPIKERGLSLNYSALPVSLSADHSGSSGSEMHLLFWSVLEQGMRLLGRSLNQVGGHFQIDSTIPVGAGMGASAALCVAMSSWFCAQKMIEQDKKLEFAKELEHLFHGRSSGLDIVGVASERGVYFKEGNSAPILQVTQPVWYLSSCNQIGITSHCIAQVHSCWEQDSVIAQQIDQQMNEAVNECKMALEHNDRDSIDNLAKAINKAADCFFKWGLVSESLQRHMTELFAAGAVAVKPTGSGGGGFVLSLWSHPQENKLDFIRL